MWKEIFLSHALAKIGQKIEKILIILETEKQNGKNQPWGTEVRY